MEIIGNRNHSFRFPLIIRNFQNIKFFQFTNSFEFGKNRHYEELNKNKEYSLTKKIFKLLGLPYESKCSYYDSSKTIFMPLSHKHCIRQCIRYHCEVKLNFSCFGITQGINQRINQLNCGFDNLAICRNTPQHMETQTLLFAKICHNLYPSDCISDEYSIIENFDNEKIYSDQKYWKLRFYWDESKPIIINEERPVMTFTDYFCYIGGLFGMWFGISAYQLLVNLRDIDCQHISRKYSNNCYPNSNIPNNTKNVALCG